MNKEVMDTINTLADMNCKKCPFCGCNAAIAKDITWLYFVQCQNCGCRTRGTQTQEEAVRIWNRRN